MMTANEVSPWWAPSLQHCADSVQGAAEAICSYTDENKFLVANTLSSLLCESGATASEPIMPNTSNSMRKAQEINDAAWQIIRADRDKRAALTTKLRAQREAAMLAGGEEQLRKLKAKRLQRRKA